MPVYQLYIVNKSGGLMYHTNFSSQAPQLTNNDILRIGGTFFGIHTIAANISPVPYSGGIETLITDSFQLECFQSITGVKFFMTADKAFQNLNTALKYIYELYSDYVLKNPFYDIDQPIRCELFDVNLKNYITGLEKAK